MPESPHVAETRASYDTVAEDYATWTQRALQEEPVLRGLLGAFAELVAAGRGRLLDAGCGPGHVTAHLKAAGADPFGVDLSPRMIDVARREHPDVEFHVGSMTSLELPDRSVGGVLACWSIIHLPVAEVPIAFAEFDRVLVPEGVLFVGFHIGEERRRKTSGYGGHPMALDVQLWTPDQLEQLLGDAGFEVTTRVVCQPTAAARVPPGVLIAQKSGSLAPP